MLNDLVLRDGLGLTEEDLRQGRGIDYTHSDEEALARLESGKAAAAFFLNPTRLDQIEGCARRGGVMPRKSSFFYPKPLSGIVLLPMRAAPARERADMRRPAGADSGGELELGAPPAGGPHVYTVSEITGEIRRTLEAGFQDVTIEGEISNYRPSSTGHFYFSLKDSEAILSAVMFRGRLASVRFQPADGMLVRARGQPVGIPEARQLPADLREPAAGGRGQPAADARGAQAAPRRRRAVRRRAQEAAAPVPAPGGRRHLPDGGGDPRHPARAQAARRGHRRGRSCPPRCRARRRRATSPPRSAPPTASAWPTCSSWAAAEARSRTCCPSPRRSWCGPSPPRASR